MIVIKWAQAHLENFNGLGPPYGFCAKVVNWFIFVEIDAHEDVVRVRTCQLRDVTKFGLPTPGTTPAV